MKRRILATATLAAVLGLAASPANAAVSAVGWWTRNPTASAPEGGLQVANSLDGVVSFGAVRAVEDGDDIQRATLTLQESGQALNGSGASLQACPAAGTWTAGKGTLADAPLADCKAGSVALARNAQGQWTGDVTSVLSGSAPSIAIYPGEGAGVFQVSFEAPKLDVELDSSGSGSGSSSGPASDFDASEFTASPTSTPSDASSGSSGGSSDFGSSSSSSTFEPSGSATFLASSGSSSTFAQTTDAGATAPAEVAASDAGAGGEAAADDAGSTFVARPAVAPPLEVGGNRWAQFGLYLAIAAVVGTIAGFGRNRLSARSA